MRWLKSLFISAFVTFLALAALDAVIHLVQGGWRWTWVGAALAAFPTAGFFAWIFLVPTARTAANLPFVTRLVVAGLVVASLAAYRQGGPFLEPLAQTALVALGWLAYVYWYSRFGERDASRLKVGSQLPAFEVETRRGGRSRRSPSWAVRRCCFSTAGTGAPFARRRSGSSSNSTGSWTPLEPRWP